MSINYKALAEAALEKRSAKVEAFRAAPSESLKAEIAALENEARSYVEQAEREAEVRSLAKRGGLSMPSVTEDQDAWRSILPSGSEYRLFQAESVPADGGFAAPSSTAARVVDQVRRQSVFLGSPGLNVIPFSGSAFVLPQITANTAVGVVAEGALIGDGKTTFDGLTFAPLKYADLRYASNELLADSAADMRSILGNEMTRTVASKIDVDAFGAGNGTTALKGLTAVGMSTNTALGAGVTTVTWDHVIDAYVAVIATGANPTVVWASADMYGPLLKQKASTAGTYLAGDVTDNPAKAALGLPLRVSANLPVRTVIVADASRVFVGVRQDVAVKVSEDSRFDNDQVGFRMTTRVAGLVVAEATSVQRITAAAA